MPGLYHRHIFLCMALLALESVATSAHAADGDSLWDLLSRTDHTALEPSRQAAQPFASDQTRRSLGPVPGFSLPLNLDAANDEVFGSRPKRKKSGMFGGLGDWWSRMEQKTNSRITASGHQTLSFRLDSISGSQSSYQDSQYTGQGSNGVYDDTQLDVDATLFNALHYHTQISNSPYRNATDNRVKLDYNTKQLRVEAGDFNPTMSGNSLIDFNLALHGIQVTDHWTPGFKSTLLYSQTTAQTHTIVVAGNGTTGPYYVYAGQIVDGSVHVRVDNKDLTLGTDYTIDLYTGQLNFLRGNVILPSSSIAVSFEALDYSNDKGTIYGARTEFTPSKGSLLGITYLTETSPSNSATALRSDSLYGYNSPNWYNTTAPIDLSKTLIVSVGGVVYGPAQYTVDTTTSKFYSNRIYIPVAVPSTVTVQIQYFPYDPNPTPGNRSIVGLDSRFSLGKIGSIQLESAFSSLGLTGKAYEGQALQMIANLTPSKDFHTRLTIRDVSPSFSSIQTPGFNQNEKSITIDSDYQLTKRLGFTLNWEKAKRPDYGSTATTIATSSTVLTSLGNDDYNQYTIGANYRLNSAATLALNRTNLSTNYVIGGSSTNTSDTFSFNYTKGQLNLQAAVANNVSNVATTYAQLDLTSPNGNNNALVNSGSTAQTKRLSTQWTPLKWLTLGGSYSDNIINTTTAGTNTGVNTDARDTAFDIDFRKIKNLHLHYTFDLSDSGNDTNTTSTPSGNVNILSTAAFLMGAQGLTRSRFAFLASQLFPTTRDVTGTTTTGTLTSGTLLGGGTNGSLGTAGSYSGGIDTSSALYSATSFGGRSATNRVNVDYTPRPGMQVGFHISQASSLGDYQYNSNNNGYGANFNWDLSKRIHVNAVYEIQKVAYTNTLGGSNTNTSVLSLTGRPFGGKLEMEFSYQSSNSQSAFNTAASTTGSTTGSTTTPTLTNTSTDLAAMRLGLNYHISKRQSLFTDITSSISSGYYANNESDISFGWNYDLTQQLGFRVGWQFQNRAYSSVTGTTAVTTGNLNYSVNSLLAQFNLHF